MKHSRNSFFSKPSGTSGEKPPKERGNSLTERYHAIKGKAGGFFSGLAEKIRQGGRRSAAAITAAALSAVCLVVLGVTLFSGGASGQSSASGTVATLANNAALSQSAPETGGDAAAGGEIVLPTPTPAPTPEPTPEFSLSYGMTDAKVSELQTRLMELGYMDEDEATEYFGTMTRAAVRQFQRQLGLEEDGVITQALWDQLMSDDAPHYTVMIGMRGDDVKELQDRLYEMGYLSSSSEVTGYFGELTEAAVKKMQELNKLRVDGKAGTATMDLLYSSDVIPNYYSYGEESDVILKYQNRLKELGYMTTTPDGKYGQDTMAAIKQFQSRNDLVADGYLGPSTIKALNSSSATPNALSIGSSGSTVQNMQRLLYQYNYIKKTAITGYYGTITEAAVKLFQKNNGLTQDGQVGRKTMNVLTGDSVKKASSPVTGGSSGSSSSKTKVQKLIDVARSKLGSKYVRGAKGSSQFDCSGFVYWCLNQVGIKQSYLTSYGWRSVGKYTKITDFGKIRAGDIVVVTGHVGIASSSSKIIDASSSNGKVVERSFQSNWWKRNFICAWRIYD